MINSESQQKRKARMTAVVLAGSIVISILSIVFAFIQKTVAEKSRAVSNELVLKLKETEQMTNLAKMEAIAQRDQAIKAEQAAQQALEECTNKKK